MSKGQKYTGERERSRAKETQGFNAARSDASPTAGASAKAPRGLTEDIDYPSDGEKEGNAQSLPEELRPPKTDWQKILTILVSVLSIFAIVVGGIVWLVRLDFKVDSAASDMDEIKPKVDQLLISSEKQNSRLDFLEMDQAAREKTSP